MSYASFTNSPASTKLPAHSVADARAIPGGVGKSRLAALLALAASTEFLLVAVAAYSAAVLYHRQLLLNPPDAAKYVQESLLIATLQLLVSIGLRQYSRIQTQPRHVFLWSGASGVLFVFSLLHLDDIPSENLRRLLARYCHSPSCERPPYGTLYTGAMVLITTACNCIGVDRRQARHSYRRPESVLAFFGSGDGHRNSDHPLVRLSDGSRLLLSTRAPRRCPSAT